MGTQVISCTKKSGADIALAVALTQAVCLEDTQPILPEHTHCQDITPEKLTPEKMEEAIQ